MFIQKRKRAIWISTMLVLTAFVGMSTNVSAQELVAEANGPYTGEECHDLVLSALGSSSGPDITYSWYFNKTLPDEIFIDASTGISTVWPVPQDDYNGTLTLIVSDGIDSATDTAEVTVLNVPPVITSVEGPSRVDVGDLVSLTVYYYDGFNDPIRGFIFSLDTYTTTFDWGDGTMSEEFSGVIPGWEPEGDSVTGTHIYTTMGIYHIIITITDDDGGIDTADWYILVNGNFALVEAGPDTTIDEGSTFESAGFLTSSEPIGYAVIVDYDDGTDSEEIQLNPGNTFDLQHVYYEDGSYYALVMVYYNGVEWGSDYALVTVNNVAPTIISMSGPDPVTLGTAIEFNAIFTDPGILDDQTAHIYWGDGSAPTIVDFLANESGEYLVDESHTYSSVGVYQITLNVTDDDGGYDNESLESYVVVYNPDSGFVTGGGWIIALQGSFPADPTLTGRCNFGFVSKYKKGQNTPEGNTEFQFQAGNLNFHSHTYEWLVIAGAKAMYKGTGTINGEGNYGFRLTAIDGQIKGGGGVDKFRIKIWNEDTNQLVFDNNLGYSDDQDPSTALSGGQITIHK
jgi:hypothetical protein